MYNIRVVYKLFQCVDRKRSDLWLLSHRKRYFMNEAERRINDTGTPETENSDLSFQLSFRKQGFECRMKLSNKF